MVVSRFVVGSNGAISTPGDALQKSSNLADLTDPEAARAALNITDVALKIRINGDGSWPTRPSPLPAGFEYVIWDATGKTNVVQPPTAEIGDACDLIAGETLQAGV